MNTPKNEHEGIDPVKKINLYEMYELGKFIAPLSKFIESDKVARNVYALWMARSNLLSRVADGTPLLKSSIRAANSLIGEIDKIISRDLEKAFDVGDDTDFGYKAISLKNDVSALESVLGNDMPDIASYVASQKGIFRTDDLIAHADNHLSSEARDLLPKHAGEDIREAGKCLAYELATACAFHLWRSVESVMGAYYKQLFGKTFPEAKVQRNWGAYIEALSKVNADEKITVFLQHIKDKYRNPQTHPDETISMEEALRLFNVALSSVEQMLLEIARLKSSALVDSVTATIKEKTEGK